MLKKSLEINGVHKTLVVDTDASLGRRASQTAAPDRHKNLLQ